MAKPSEGTWIGIAAGTAVAVVAYAAFQGMIGLRIALPLLAGIPILFAATGLTLPARAGLATGFALLFSIYALAGVGQWPGIEFAGPAVIAACWAIAAAYRADGTRDGKLNGLFICWIFVLLIAVLIGLFSGPSGSSGVMRRLLENLGVSPASMDSVIFVIRKSVHVGCYLCAALLAALGLRGQALALPMAGVWALSFAVYDEWNQASFPGRTGTPKDLLWDGAGVAVGLLLAGLILRKKR